MSTLAHKATFATELYSGPKEAEKRMQYIIDFKMLVSFTVASKTYFRINLTKEVKLSHSFNAIPIKVTMSFFSIF